MLCAQLVIYYQFKHSHVQLPGLNSYAKMQQENKDHCMYFSNPYYCTYSYLLLGSNQFTTF